MIISYFLAQVEYFCYMYCSFFTGSQHSHSKFKKPSVTNLSETLLCCCHVTDHKAEESDACNVCKTFHSVRHEDCSIHDSPPIDFAEDTVGVEVVELGGMRAA